MKKPKLNALTFLLFIGLASSTATAQLHQNFGPSLTALGNNGAISGDAWSLEGNAAGIIGVKSPTIAINYVKYAFDTGLSNQSAIFVVPFKRNYFGISVQKYGIPEYDEAHISLAYAKKFGEALSLAIKTNYHQLKIENYGKDVSFSISIGVMYQLNETFIVGFYSDNPTREKFNNKSILIELPSVYCVGASYKASDKILLATKIGKTLSHDFDIGLGISYQMMNLISFRGGLTTSPFKQYAGFGLIYKNLCVDLAIENDFYLGIIPQIGLSYAF